MTYFRKAKPAHQVLHPQICHRCHKRPGTLRIHPISSAAVGTVADASEDWWLCGECVEAIRPDDPSRS